MRIIKEGEVLFRGGKIVSVQYFEVEGNGEGSLYHSLQDYIKDNYIFKGNKKLNAR